MFSKLVALFYNINSNNNTVKFFYILTNTLLSIFFRFARLVCVERYLIIVLTWISLEANDAEHLFMSYWVLGLFNFFWRRIYSHLLPIF